MAKKRRSEAGAVVIFFQTQPLDVARSILDICQDTVIARMPKTSAETVKGTTKKGRKSDQQILLTAGMSTEE